MKQIAVLGCGAMGSRIVQNWLKANHPVIVYNRTADRVKSLLNQGAVYAATPRSAAAQADIVVSMVTDDDVSRLIWLDPETGAVQGLKPGAIAIESSTLTVAWTKELAASIACHDAAFLDAPVVGSRPQAEAGKLIYLVGGESETLAQVQAILSSTSARIHHIGAVGQGMTMKLAVNALFGIQVAALAEIIGMLNQNGITSEKAMACLSDLPVISLAAKGAGSLMVMNQHAPLFPIALVEKDFRYIIQTAQAYEVSTPTTTAVHRVYREAISKGYSNDNITAVTQLFS